MLIRASVQIKKIVANAPEILNQTVKWAYQFSARLFVCPNVTCHSFGRRLH